MFQSRSIRGREGSARGEGVAAGIVEFSGAGVCIECRQSCLDIMDINSFRRIEVAALVGRPPWLELVLDEGSLVCKKGV